ncbi:MAG TPA: hypothetical protein VGH80_08830 [Xanthomonadaceae bacterium]|jgi:hypothetical protein
MPDAIKLVIVHGWSDTAASFDHIAERLIASGLKLDVATIRLADYVSLNDTITFADLREAMMTAWRNQGLPLDPRSVDVIVHSTGALVTRDWMTTYFTPATNPINRLVMLAPANFGSPLATMGRSLIGRIVKGFGSDLPFQTGTQILKGLEIASPYSWELAKRDRFDPDNTWYGPGRVLCSVLVGTSGYTGISALANKPGTDGTVRVSTANLNPQLVTADFSTDPLQPTFKSIPCNGRTAFLRIADENHGTIAQGGTVATTLGKIIQALGVTDATFDVFADQWDAASAAARDAVSDDDHAFAHGYQNTVVHLVDDQAQPVTDYIIEAYVPKAGADTSVASNIDDDATQYVQEKIIADAHPWTDDNSYRALLFDCTRLKAKLIDPGRSMEISVTAHPQLQDKSAGYRTFGYNDIGGILLDASRMGQLFVPDRTLLLDMTIARYQQDLFTFRPPH